MKGSLRWCFDSQSVMMSSTQKWAKNVQIGISCTKVDRKMKAKSETYFEVNCSFMKPFSLKRTQTSISCANSDSTMESKSKRNFEVRYCFMKLFYWNLQILAQCYDVIISVMGQKDYNLYIVYNCKNTNIRNISSKSPYRSGFDLSTTRHIWYISWVHFGITLILGPFLTQF